MFLAAVPAHGAKKQPLQLRRVPLELPGMPAKIIPADVDGDGRRDLALVLAFTEVESIMVDRVEQMTQITTVIPAVFDRRELRVYLARADGSYELSGTLPLDKSVLAVEQGPGAAPLMLLTDDGVAGVELGGEGEAPLVLRPIIERRTVLAGSESFFSRLEWVVDLDGDGERDVLFPGPDGLAVHPSREGKVATTAIQVLALPGDHRESSVRTYPLVRVQEIDGDGHLDLFVRARYAEHGELHVFRGGADGRFRPLYAGEADCALGESALRRAGEGSAYSTRFEDVTWLGDLDGDGRAELVFQKKIDPEKQGLRASIRDFKRPLHVFRFHRLRDDLRIEAEPYFELEAEGWSFSTETNVGDFEQFSDLDGDGSKELVTLRFDFSMLGALKGLATKRMKLKLEFDVWAQTEQRGFRKVPNLDLTENLKLNLRKADIGAFAQFAGDYDGDGLVDFVHFGRGKQITIHRGQPGARYAADPDLVVLLEEEPQDLQLIRVGHYDDDDRSDIAILRELFEEDPDEDTTPDVAIDLYLSGTP